MDLRRSSMDRYKICTQHRGDVKADHLLSIFSPQPLKIGEEKTSIFEDRRQLEVHNFEAVQHIANEIRYFI